MERLSEWIVKQRHKILIGFVILLLISGYASRYVVTNFEMTKYLSEDMGSIKSLNIMKDEFGLPTSVRAMVKDVTLSDAIAMKAQIARVDGVNSILWLDDVSDIFKPLDTLPQAALDQYYQE